MGGAARRRVLVGDIWLAVEESGLCHSFSKANLGDDGVVGVNSATLTELVQRRAMEADPMTRVIGDGGVGGARENIENGRGSGVIASVARKTMVHWVVLFVGCIPA